MAIYVSAFYWLVEDDLELKGEKVPKVIGKKLKWQDVLVARIPLKRVLRQYVTFLFAVSVGIINLTFKALNEFLAESCVISLLIASRRFF